MSAGVKQSIVSAQVRRSLQRAARALGGVYVPATRTHYGSVCIGGAVLSMQVLHASNGEYCARFIAKKAGADGWAADGWTAQQAIANLNGSKA